jgi:acyl carrier protein
MLRSTEAVFETIDFARPVPEKFEREIHLAITSDARIDGFLLWLKIEAAPRVEIETLELPDTWLPVYLPAFYPGLDVERGDEINATVRGALAKNGLNRDYQITGRVLQKNGTGLDFAFDSPHYEPIYRNSPFYQRLFLRDTIEVAAPHDSTSEGALISELRKTMPDYMVPSAIVVLDALPRTPNGKLDRRSLPAPDYAAPSDGSPIFVAPRTAIEERLQEIWRKNLSVERIGVHDHFLALGGESLLALRIVNRLREALGENIPLGVIFESPTIEGLSQYLENNYALAVQRWLSVQTLDTAQNAAAKCAESGQPIARLARDPRRLSSKAGEAV